MSSIPRNPSIHRPPIRSSPRPRYYKRSLINGTYRLCHPTALLQWRTIDAEDEEDVVFINEDVANMYKCAICMNILTDPKSVSCSGGHLFCKHCITQMLRSQNPNPPETIPCPTCREPFTIADIRDDHFANRIIGNLMVKCVNHKIIAKRAALYRQREVHHIQSRPSGPRRSSRERVNHRNERRSRSRSRERNRNNEANHDEKEEVVHETCAWEGEYNRLSSHLSVCAFAIEACAKCGMPLMRNEMEEHQRNCPWLSLYCEQCRGYYVKCEPHLCPLENIACRHCAHEVVRLRYGSHLKTCPRLRVHCKFQEYGCNQMVIRENMQQHLEQNQAYHLTLLGHKYDELKQIEEQYEELQEKYDGLEEQYQTLQEDHDQLEYRVLEVERFTDMIFRCMVE